MDKTVQKEKFVWYWSERKVIQDFFWLLWVLKLNKRGDCLSDGQLKFYYLNKV